MRLKKGSREAISAGRKAAETRARNKALSEKSKAKSPTKISVKRVKFKKLEESNYHKITINSPVDVYVHKKLNSLYISPHNTILNASDKKPTKTYQNETTSL